MSSLRKRSIRFATVAAMLSSAAGLAQLANSTAPAHADPAGLNSLVGVGSDTIQDLFNAFAGAEPTPGVQPAGLTPLATKYYLPLQSQAGSNSLTISSFDAIDPHAAPTPGVGQSITPKPGSATFDRPNGSGEGRKALLASTSGTPFQTTSGTSPNGLVAVTGAIDFARSSSISTSVGTTLTYLPVGEDGVSYAFHCGTASGALPNADCDALSHLSTPTLAALYSPTGTGTLAAGASGWTGTSTLNACAIQTSSGTFGFFGTQVGGATFTQAAMRTAVINGHPGPGPAPDPSVACVDLEENNVNGFASRVTTLDAAADWVVPVSVGSEIGQHNAFALDRSGTGLGTVPKTDIGQIDAVAAGTHPFTGFGTPTWAPPASGGYYNGTFGRMVFVVAPSAKVGTGFGHNQAMNDLFDAFGATGKRTAAAASFTAGVPSITAAAATFSAADVGHAVSDTSFGLGTFIPAGTTITAVNPAGDTATLSAAPTGTAGPVSVFVAGTAAMCSAANVATAASAGFGQSLSNSSQGAGACGAPLVQRAG